MTNISHLKNKRIGLAVSGGVDSVVLLDVFNRLRKKYNLKLFVLHYNHKWRKESYLDTKLVEKYCKKYGINFLYKETRGKVIKNEEIARNQRYKFFKQESKKNDLDYICTAHHLDDQVETILFRLARGTGTNGLLPVKEMFDLLNKTKVFRPFLYLTKKQIYDYARNNRLSFNEDKTNVDTKYKRNLIRKKIIPNLKEINKDATRNLLACSELAYSQSKALDRYFLSLLEKISVKSPQNWSKERFLKFNDDEQKAFIYWFLIRYGIKGSLVKINVIKDAIENKKKIDLSKQYRLIVNDKNVVFHEKQKKKITQQKVDLNNNGVIKLKPFLSRDFNNNFPPDKDKRVFVNLSKYTNKNLSIRYRKPGDVFQPLGFSKTIKLKKYLINKKISKDRRYNLPLLCFKNEVLWIPGYSLSEKLRVVDKPTHMLKMK